MSKPRPVTLQQMKALLGKPTWTWKDFKEECQWAGDFDTQLSCGDEGLAYFTLNASDYYSASISLDSIAKVRAAAVLMGLEVKRLR